MAYLHSFAALLGLSSSTPLRSLRVKPAAQASTGDSTTVVMLGTGAPRPVASIEQAARGVDILVHEVHPQSVESLADVTGRKDWGDYLRAFHTSDVGLGKLAAAAQPKELVLYHFGAHGAADAEVIANIRAQGYTGKIVVAKDLDRF